MRTYIDNLTDNLITKNHYGQVFKKLGDGLKSDGLTEFIKHVKLDLLSGDVQKMNPKTLVKIMCSSEHDDDNPVYKSTLFASITFSGDFEEMLREMVSLCLAFAIYDRIENYRCQRCREFHPCDCDAEKEHDEQMQNRRECRAFHKLGGHETHQSDAEKRDQDEAWRK